MAASPSYTETAYRFHAQSGHVAPRALALGAVYYTWSSFMVVGMVFPDYARPQPHLATRLTAAAIYLLYTWLLPVVMSWSWRSGVSVGDAGLAVHYWLWPPRRLPWPELRDVEVTAAGAVVETDHYRLALGPPMVGWYALAHEAAQRSAWTHGPRADRAVATCDSSTAARVAKWIDDSHGADFVCRPAVGFHVVTVCGAICIGLASLVLSYDNILAPVIIAPLLLGSRALMPALLLWALCVAAWWLSPGLAQVSAGWVSLAVAGLLVGHWLVARRAVVSSIRVSIGGIEVQAPRRAMHPAMLQWQDLLRADERLACFVMMTTIGDFAVPVGFTNARRLLRAVQSAADRAVAGATATAPSVDTSGVH